jgi:DNA repair photolyase
VTIREIEAKSILRKHKRIDSWFVSRYGMNLYRGCAHNCTYCDGRSEGYYVDGEFGRDVSVKTNAIEILRKELDPKRKRQPLKRCFVLIGGGVSDSYQPIERKYRLCRSTLGLLQENNLPVHILTKSSLVKRDVDILKRINETSRVIVSFSFSSVDDKLSAVFEPNVPPPSERLETIKLLKDKGFACGMFLLPVIPFVTDSPKYIEEALNQASQVGVNFVIFGGLTLKQGIQKDYFINTLKNHYPEIIPRYQIIYQESKWGEAIRRYSDAIHQIFSNMNQKYKLPIRMPPALYEDLLDLNDKLIVTLEHIHYLLALKGRKTSYGYAAYSISQLRDTLSITSGGFKTVPGISSEAKEVIQEMIETGSSSLLKMLLYE